MKKGLGILLLVLGVLMCASTVYAAQAVVLDPLVDYAVKVGVQTAIPVGASFKDYGNHTQRVMSVTGGGTFNRTEWYNKRIAGVVNTANMPVGTHTLVVNAFDYNTGVSAQGSFRVTVINPNETPPPPMIFDAAERIKISAGSTFYSIPIGVSRADGEFMTLNVSGIGPFGTGYITFVPLQSIGGRIEGRLEVYLTGAGEYDVTMIATHAQTGMVSKQQIKLIRQSAP